jgi:4'-phosphopantetheinyl transferase
MLPWAAASDSIPESATKGATREWKKGRVDVWVADLDRLAPRLGDAEAFLSPEEAARARRFRFPRDRTRYVIQRGVLRLLLGRYTARDPGGLDIRCDPNGKPYLAGGENGHPCRFSMSDSSGLAVFALGPQESLGVDMEEIRDLPEMNDIVSRHFTAREREAFLSCPESRRLLLFYRFWTRKEAVLKALGEGLLIPLDSVEAADVEYAGPRPIHVGGPSGKWEFSVTDVDVPPGFSAAVATDGPIGEVRLHFFPATEGMDRA